MIRILDAFDVFEVLFVFVGVMFDQRIMLMHQQKKYLFVPNKKTKHTKIGTNVMCITPLFA